MCIFVLSFILAIMVVTEYYLLKFNLLNKHFPIIYFNSLILAIFIIKVNVEHLFFHYRCKRKILGMYA